MPIIKRKKLYSLYSITHRATGCYHLVVTYLSPEHFSIQPLVSYINDFKKRTHKINNHALREFSAALAPFKVDDFDLRTVVSNVEHSEAKAKALIESMHLGTDKLLTAHLVKPVLWELNLSAKLRMQNGEPSPYLPAQAIEEAVPKVEESIIETIPLPVRLKIIRQAADGAEQTYKERCWIEDDKDGFTGWRWDKFGVTRTIVSAANKYGNLIIAGARHYDIIMDGVIDLVGLDAFKAYAGTAGYDQGFIDQYGTFYSRKAAMKLCVDQGRPLLPSGGSNSTLFSEHLY